MIAIIIPVIIALISIYAIKLWLSKENGDKSSSNISGPLALPIIGNSYLFRDGVNPFIKMTKLSEKYGDIYSLKFGSTKCVVVSSVENIRSTLLQNGKFFGGRPNFMRFNKLFGDDRQNSLALCDWSKLQVRRRNISRKYCDAGKNSPVKELICEISVSEAKEAINLLKVRGLEAYKKGEDLKLKPIIMRMALNIFSQYMCSTRFDPENDSEFQNIVNLFDNVFWDVNQGHPVDFFPWLSPLFSSHMKKLSDWTITVRKFILARIINQRETTLDDEDEERDFTDALLKALKHESIFTRDAILFALEDFLGGSSALGNVVMLLLGFMAKNPEAAAKVQKEIDDLTNGQRPPTLFDVDSLPYTLATIKESIRLCSSPIVPHVAMEEGNVEGNKIEKGTLILINNYKLNISEKYWENPTEFKPERFLNKSYIEVKNERRGSEHDSGVESENESKKNGKMNKKTVIPSELITNSSEKTIKKEVYTMKTNLHHYIPFSIGQRTCLGRNLLMDCGFVIFSNIMQNFNISSMHPEQIKMYPACIALPPETYGLTITPRKC